MARLGKLDIVIGLQDRVTKQLASVSKKVEGRLGKLNKHLTPARVKAAGRAAKYTGLATLGLAGALAIATKAAIAHETAQAHTADRLGISVGLLKTLRYATEAAGGKAETVDKAIKKLTQTIGDAASGLTENQRAFKSLGVEYLTAAGKGRTAQAVLLDLADSFEAAGQDSLTAGNRAILFGRGFLEMTKTLVGGRKGIEQLSESLRIMGVNMSQDAARKAQGADQALTLLSYTIKENFTRVLIQAAPRVQEVAQSVAALVSAASQLGTGETIAAIAAEFKAQLFGWGDTAKEMEARLADLQSQREKYLKRVNQGGHAGNSARLALARINVEIAAEKESVKKRLAFQEAYRQGREASEVLVAGADSRLAAQQAAVAERKAAEATAVLIQHIQAQQKARARDGATAKQALANQRDDALAALAEQVKAAQMAGLSIAAAKRAIADEQLEIQQAFLRKSQALDDAAAAKKKAVADQAAAAETVARGEATERSLNRVREMVQREAEIHRENRFSREQIDAQNAAQSALNFERDLVLLTERGAIETGLLAQIETAKSQLTTRAVAFAAAADIAAHRDRVDSALSVAGQLSTLGAAAFENSKGLAVASAVVSGIGAAVENYRHGSSIGGPPLGAAFAALSVAATSAMISRMRSATPASASVGAGAPAAGAAATQQGPQISASITIEGGDNARANEIAQGVRRELVDLMENR